MRSITWYISSRWNLIPYLVFPYTRISYSICNFYGAIISLTIRDVSYSLPCKMIALFGPLKNGFWGQKKEDLTSWANRPQRNTPTTKTGFWMHWAKIHASQGKLWMHWRNQENKKAREGTTSPICPPHPDFGGHHILHVGSDCGRNHTCQISSESVLGFWSPRGRKWPSPIDLAHRPYNSVRTNVLHCDAPTVLKGSSGDVPGPGLDWNERRKICWWLNKSQQ